MPRPWNIVVTAGLNGVSKDNILTIPQSTSKNNLSPKHYVFETWHRWSRYSVATNSCHDPGILLTSQPMKTTFPVPKHHYLESWHRWSSNPVATNPFPDPVRFLRQHISVLAGQLITSCVNHIFPTVLPDILKNLSLASQKKRDKMFSDPIHSRIIYFHILLFSYIPIFFFLYVETIHLLQRGVGAGI